MNFFKVKSVAETYELIEQHVTPMSEPIILPLLDVLHYVLAEDIIAVENVPNFRRSSVDGYAVKASDTFGASESMPAFLQVIGHVQMGEATTLAVQAGETVYVPTGGMIPEGSDAVLMIEHGEDLGGLMQAYRQMAPGENVIGIGEDVSVGALLIKRGTILRAQELGALAAQGILEVKVERKPIVGYISSGDEIVPMDTADLRPGLVRDMNAVTIGAMVKEWGCSFVYGGIALDRKEELRQCLADLLDEVDFLIVSGGSSVGTKDHSLEVIESLGEPGVYVHGVAVKPGKPTILAKAGGKPVLGLPGHPASAMIIFQQFGRKIVDRLQGLDRPAWQHSVAAKLAKNIPSAAGRTDYIRIKLTETEHGLEAVPVHGKSGLLTSLVNSDGLLEVPQRSEGIAKDEHIQVQLFT